MKGQPHAHAHKHARQTTPKQQTTQGAARTAGMSHMRAGQPAQRTALMKPTKADSNTTQTASSIC